MIVSLLKVIFGKVVGLDKIPAEKKEIFWARMSDYSVKLAGELAEGTAKGLKSESR